MDQLMLIYLLLLPLSWAVEAVTVYEGCGAVIKDVPEGIINYPGEGQNVYPNNAKCVWNIVIGEMDRMNVSFQRFETFRRDKLRVRNGKNGIIIGNYNGKDSLPPQNFTTEGNQLYLYFRSNRKHTNKGFKLTWKTIINTDYCMSIGGITYNSKCLFFSVEKKNWHDAAAACASIFKGGQLASLTENPTEDRDYVLTNYDGYYWTGASDIKNEGTWVWLNGKPFDWSMWSRNQPNSWGGDQDCMILQREDIYNAAGYNDVSCTNMYQYICETSNFHQTRNMKSEYSKKKENQKQKQINYNSTSRYNNGINNINNNNSNNKTEFDEMRKIHKKSYAIDLQPHPAKGSSDDDSPPGKSTFARSDWMNILRKFKKRFIYLASKVVLLKE